MAEKLVNRARSALLAGQDPGSLCTERVDLSGLDSYILRGLPHSIKCHSLDLSDTLTDELPVGWRASYSLTLKNCSHLKSLPEGLKVSVLNVAGCSSLTRLPENLDVNFLDASNCRGLVDWPDSAKVSIGSVSIQGCNALSHLPCGLGPLSSLNVRDCRSLRFLPQDLRIRSWLDLAGSGLTGLPESLSHVPLRWKGVLIDAQIAFFPETIPVSNVLQVTNAEVRRVLIERIGFERFLREGKAEVVHSDHDSGGKRELLRIQLSNDEDLVCLSVLCPSTGRHYLIRVPPASRTCHEAVAWTAGFDNPNDYRPLVET